jgi:hypothetical protein
LISDEIVRGMGEAPAAMANAWGHAPARVSYRGAEYSRDSARTPRERAWYLAAAAVGDPASVLRMSPAHRHFDTNGEGHYYLDADPGELNAARATYATARAARSAMERKIRTYESEQRKWEAERKKKWAIDVPGQVYADAKINWYKDQVEQMRLALAGLQSAEDDAQAAVGSAQQALNDANRQIRQQEEQARQQQLAQQQQDAAAQAQAQAAAARDASAQASSSDYWAMTASPGGAYPGTDAALGAAQGGAWDPFAIQAGSVEDMVAGGAGDVSGYPLDMSGVDYVDTHGGGDLEAARERLRDEGRDLPGVTRHPSPYCFDRYYDGTEPDYLAAMFGWHRVEGAPKGAMGADDLAEAVPLSDPRGTAGPARPAGSDGFGAVTAVLGAILKAAPELLAELRQDGPPPSSTTSRSAPGTPLGEGVSRSILEATGLNKILDEKADAAAKAAGDRAGRRAASGITTAGLWLAVAVLGGAYVLAHRG